MQSINFSPITVESITKDLNGRYIKTSANKSQDKSESSITLAENVVVYSIKMRLRGRNRKIVKGTHCLAGLISSSLSALRFSFSPSFPQSEVFITGISRCAYH